MKQNTHHFTQNNLLSKYFKIESQKGIPNEKSKDLILKYQFSQNTNFEIPFFFFLTGMMPFLLHRVWFYSFDCFSFFCLLDFLYVGFGVFL